MQRVTIPYARLLGVLMPENGLRRESAEGYTNGHSEPRDNDVMTT